MARKKGALKSTLLHLYSIKFTVYAKANLIEYVLRKIHYLSLVVIKLTLLFNKNHFAFWVQYKQKEGDEMKTEFAEKYITLGLKIAYYRRKAGFTQEYFAELIGKSVSFVGQVEGTGSVRGVSLETLFKMAKVLNITPSKLLEDD